MRVMITIDHPWSQSFNHTILARVIETLRAGGHEVDVLDLHQEDFDPVLRDSYLLYGIDLEALAKKQDIVMIEGFGLPLWEEQPKPRLANGACRRVEEKRAIIRLAIVIASQTKPAGCPEYEKCRRDERRQPGQDNQWRIEW